MAGGKAAAAAGLIEGQATTWRATAPDNDLVWTEIAPPLAEVLTAARDGRVVAIGTRWVVDVSWLARTAIYGGLAANVGVEDQARLKLTEAGGAAVTRLYGNRAIAEGTRIVRARRQGRAEVIEEFAERARRRRPYRVAAEVGWAVLLLAAGAAIAYLAQMTAAQ